MPGRKGIWRLGEGAPPGLDEAALLAAIVESAADAIVSKDLNGIVTSWNGAAERIFGYTAQEMIGNPIRIIAAPDRLDEMPAILERIRRGERIEHYETRRRRKDGEVIDVDLTVSPVLDVDGRIVGASKIARDISERKLLEQALLRQSELLARHNAELRQFAHITSHDLQEPLRTITSFSQLLAHRYRGRLDSDADEFISFITGASNRMGEMIRDVLAYSQIRDDEELPIEHVDVGECVQTALQNLERAVAETGATIQVGDLPPVTAEHVLVMQVFQNLVSNSLKYRSSEPPHIRIEGFRDGTQCTFSVTDNGVGIAAEYHRKVFGLFQRLHTDGHPGTGIGLALCKKIVERWGGRIWIESEPGKGSTFRFTLPAA